MDVLALQRLPEDGAELYGNEACELGRITSPEARQLALSSSTSMCETELVWW